jgi:hypothetical protein
VRHKTSLLDISLTRQTEKYLKKIQRRENRLRTRLRKIDSNVAKSLFANSDAQYAAFSERITNDTIKATGLHGEYQPYVDSLQGALSFLQQQQAKPQLLQSATSQLQILQGKLQTADELKAFTQAREQQIKNYLQQHTDIASLLGKQFQSMNQDLYYYSQQVRGYKAMLNDPDKLEKEALNMLQKLPAFQAFMKQNSQLAGLFGLPSNYGTPQGLAGLQTRDQVSALINSQVTSGGAGGMAALQSNLQSAQSQLDTYKDKLSQLGQGSGDIDMPNFKPNEQKTKTFWKRIEYGTNFQTTHNNYYFPTTSDLGLSIGYKLDDKSTIGLGASYKLGWGNGIDHMSLSSQGAGLRSFIDCRIKGSFSATGGLEYNYNTPFASLQNLKHVDNWTTSGLIGITKTISMKNRFFKKTKIQLLWDFLSYRQLPKTQPVLFRIGYTF